MFCIKCGNEMEDGEKFCGKCGNKVGNIEKEQKDNTELNKKVVYAIISIIIVIVVGLAIFIFGNNSKLNFNSLFNKNIINNEELVNILKNTDNGIGIYLQEGTVKIGPTIDITNNNYDKLISYSCTYINESVTLNAGGLLLYNKKEKTSKVVSLGNDVSSIIYYFNDEDENEKLEDIMKEVMNYINIYGEDSYVNMTTNTEAFMQMGRKIGEIAGVKLCRNIAQDSLKKLANVPDEFIFLYKTNEIFNRYTGAYITEKEYCWGSVMSESMVNYYYMNNYSTYKTLVSIYGQPYKTVKKFAVYDSTTDGTPLVNKYDTLEKAKTALNIEE